MDIQSPLQSLIVQNYTYLCFVIKYKLQLYIDITLLFTLFSYIDITVNISITNLLNKCCSVYKLIASQVQSINKRDTSSFIVIWTFEISRCRSRFLRANMAADMAANMSTVAVGLIRVKVANYKFQIECGVMRFYYNAVIVLVLQIVSYENHSHNNLYYAHYYRPLFGIFRDFISFNCYTFAIITTVAALEQEQQIF